MSKAGRIISITPPYAIPGGEVAIECEGFEISATDDYGVVFDGRRARLVGASANRILAIVPEAFDSTEIAVQLENGDERSEPAKLVVGKKLAEDLHIVANPAIDPRTVRSS
jgi:hypothetical protein